MEIMVSFVVPVYNVGKYIEKCIQSMLEQTDNRYEIILVDDGSTDGSGEICDKYHQMRNVHIYHQDNAGASAARNCGIEHATGKWICFVDGDDYVNNNLVEIISQKEKCDIIFFGYNKFRNNKYSAYVNEQKNGVELNKEDFRNLQYRLLNVGNKFAKDYAGFEGTPWAKVYNREFLVNADMKYTLGVPKGQDGLFNLNVYRYAETGCYIKNCLYNYRISNASICHKYNPNMCEYSDILIRNYQENIHKWKDTELEKEIPYFVMKQFMYNVLLDFCHKNNKKNYEKRRKEYYSNRKKYFDEIKSVRLKNMKTKEAIFALMIKYMPFCVMDLIVKIVG